MKGVFPILVVGVAMYGCKSSGPGDLAGKLLEVSRSAGFPLTDPVKDDLEEMLDLAEKRVRAKSGTGRIEELNRLIFSELGFEREVEDESVEFMLLPCVIQNRKGSCLGLAAVYLVLAERLELEIRGVLVPRHFFLRHRQRNIELLREGEAMPDEWYQKTWRVPAEAGAYMRPLSEKELLAVCRFNLGNVFRTQGAYQRAESIYRGVIEDFPDFAEAHANLGLVLHLRRDFPAAEQAYLKAQSLQPGLPGLSGNLEALQTDMGGVP